MSIRHGDTHVSIHHGATEARSKLLYEELARGGIVRKVLWFCSVSPCLRDTVVIKTCRKRSN
jgi:hypothetical protein